jgi:chaperonin GroES
MQHTGPSPVLFQLLGVLLEAGKELGGVRSILQGQQTPASTDPAALYAILEQGQKVFKDIFKRVYHSLTEEFRELFKMNKKHLPEPGERFQTGDLFEKVTKKDYEMAGGVEPVADPDMITDIQRMGRAQFLLSMKDDPIMDGIEIRKRALEAAGIENIEALIPDRGGPSPMDQVTFERAKAEIDKVRADEIEKHTSALLNMMKARQIASEMDTAMLDKQIKLTMLHLEGVQNLIQATQAEARMIEIRSKNEVEREKVQVNAAKRQS